VDEASHAVAWRNSEVDGNPALRSAEEASPWIEFDATSQEQIYSTSSRSTGAGRPPTAWDWEKALGGVASASTEQSAISMAIAWPTIRPESSDVASSVLPWPELMPEQREQEPFRSDISLVMAEQQRVLRMIGEQMGGE
jgi:hypothetical protein